MTYDNKGTSYIEQILSTYMQKCEQEKQKIIAQRISDLGLIFDIETEKISRFKKLMVESHIDQGMQSWYFNDGSPEGLHLVTFFDQRPKLSDSWDNRKASYTIDTGFTYVYDMPPKEN